MPRQGCFRNTFKVAKMGQKYVLSDVRLLIRNGVLYHWSRLAACSHLVEVFPVLLPRALSYFSAKNFDYYHARARLSRSVVHKHRVVFLDGLAYVRVDCKSNHVLVPHVQQCLRTVIESDYVPVVAREYLYNPSYVKHN